MDKGDKSRGVSAKRVAVAMGSLIIFLSVFLVDVFYFIYGSKREKALALIGGAFFVFILLAFCMPEKYASRIRSWKDGIIDILTRTGNNS